MVKNCKAQTRGMESNRQSDSVKVNGSNHHSRGESLRERERKKAGKGRKEGEMTGDCVGRETESKRERERGEGLKKYELVYDLAAGSIKKGEDCKQDVVMPTLFFLALMRTSYSKTYQRVIFLPPHLVTLFLVRFFSPES